MFCKMRLSEQIHTVYCVTVCTTDGTLVQSVKVKVCIGTDARCSNLVRSVHDLCTAKKCRQKSFGHSILAEQVAVWNVPARGEYFSGVNIFQD